MDFSIFNSYCIQDHLVWNFYTYNTLNANHIRLLRDLMDSRKLDFH